MNKKQIGLVQFHLEYEKCLFPRTAPRNRRSAKGVRNPLDCASHEEFKQIKEKHTKRSSVPFLKSRKKTQNLHCSNVF